MILFIIYNYFSFSLKIYFVFFFEYAKLEEPLSFIILFFGDNIFSSFYWLVQVGTQIFTDEKDSCYLKGFG